MVIILSHLIGGVGHFKSGELQEHLYSRQLVAKIRLVFTYCKGSKKVQRLMGE